MSEDTGSLYRTRPTHLFTGPADLILVEGREILLNCRARVRSIVHENLQCRKLALIVRPVITVDKVPPTRL